MDHEDEGMDVELIKQVLSEALEPLIAVVKQIINKQAAMDEELDALSKLVNEEIIGGITNLYKTEERLHGISDLSTKYGEKFGPYNDFYKELSNGADPMEKLYEELEERKSSKEDWKDEDEAGTVDELVKELASRFDRFKGIAAPKATEIEIEVSSEPKEMSDADKLKDKIRKMKELNTKNGKSSY